MLILDRLRLKLETGLRRVLPRTLDGRVSAPIVTMGLTELFLVLFSALTAYMIYGAYQDAVSRSQTRATASAYVVAAHTQWLMEASFQALRRIDAAAGDRLSALQADAIGDLNEAVQSLPGNVQAWVFDANGMPRLTNAGTSQRVNAADRDYFLAIKAGRPFEISQLITSRSIGENVFVVAKRLERNGVFVGCAIIVLPATVLSQFRSSLELGPQSTVALFRDDGLLITRDPVPDAPQDLSKYVLFTDYLPKSMSGTYFARSPTDGVDRVVAYRRVDGHPLVAIAAISQSEAFANYWQSLRTVLIVAVPGLIGLLLMALWTARLLRRDELSRQALSLALDGNQTLFREFHHRVKNNLQQVSALVQLQKLPADAKREMDRRIAAMVAVHEHIYRSDQFERVDVADYIPKLVQELRESYGDGVSIACQVEPAEVDREHALPLGLLINEVVSNAVKHGFTDGREGHISIALSTLADGRARLTISDNGVGFDPASDSKGMGTRLIRGLAAQLDADYRFEAANGTRFVLVFALVGVAA
ncbi:sensor histidine kinase [uncultured Devosia sp.]|uniref:sensor histidine kinase n=1 Tax=uncultured Devosia sp. TaxID=211434 RepID=UPI0035CBC3A1